MFSLGIVILGLCHSESESSELETVSESDSPRSCHSERSEESAFLLASVLTIQFEYPNPRPSPPTWD